MRFGVSLGFRFWSVLKLHTSNPAPETKREGKQIMLPDVVENRLKSDNLKAPMLESEFAIACVIVAAWKCEGRKPCPFRGVSARFSNLPAWTSADDRANQN